MPDNAASRLVQHYVDNFRRLPWRSPPGAAPPDAYRVWLSEVMLQQTSVATVAPRFERFVSRWPTIEALAAAPEADVLGEWAGLGYYARARNLIACARAVAALGKFPNTSAALRQLPGVGAYTSAAIAAIAFAEAAPAVDTNVRRVLARLAAEAAPVERDIEQRLVKLMANQRPGDVVQALMDLGATICRPKQPRCGDCPLRHDCAAFASGDAEAFPAPRLKKARPHRRGIAWWTERDGHVWLVRRPAKGLLGGMPALPGPEWTEDGPAARVPIASVRHVFTHFSLDLSIHAASAPEGKGWWQPIDGLATAGLPTLYRKAVAAVLARRHALAA